MRFLKASLLLVLVLTFARPMFGFAATCTCYCGNYNDGAYSAGAQDSGTTCHDACDGVGDKFVGCYESESQFPYNDEKCWTEVDCEAFSKITATGRINGEWADSPSPYCSQTKSGTEMRYCYPDGKAKVNLNVDVGSLTEAGDIGEYIVAAYDWLIPAAALIAVTMMMIGGLQYAFARGKSGYIDKGKKRITNAIAGLVLLLSAYVIARLIDPRLVSFDALKTPILKEVTMLSPDETCSSLADAGFTIQSSGGTSCGNKGTISSIDNVKANVSTGSWKVGDSCDYSFCPNDASCMSDGTCKNCAEIPTPSATLCAQAQKLGTGSDGGTYIYCTYDATIDSCFSAAYPGMSQGFTCAQVQAAARSAGTACSTYSTALRLDWTIAGNHSNSGVLNSALGDVLKTICEADVCGLAPIPTRCTYSEQSGTTIFGTATVTATCTNI